jgi:hypothetical protein
MGIGQLSECFEQLNRIVAAKKQEMPFDVNPIGRR